MIQINEAYQKKGYSVEESGDYVLVWHRKNQIALLLNSTDIDHKIEETVSRRIKELKDIEEKTGWKQDSIPHLSKERLEKLRQSSGCET